MKFKKYIFAINSYDQAVNTIKICYNWKILPIIYIKYFMVNGLGPDWVEEFNNLLKKQFSVKKFKLCVDCKNNYGLTSYYSSSAGMYKPRFFVLSHFFITGDSCYSILMVNISCDIF